MSLDEIIKRWLRRKYGPKHIGNHRHWGYERNDILRYYRGFSGVDIRAILDREHLEKPVRNYSDGTITAHTLDVDAEIPPGTKIEL